MVFTMRHSLLFLVIFVFATISILDAVPVSQSQISSDNSESQQKTLSDQDGLTPIKSSSDGRVLVREKRTIGFLRQLFPGLSQIVDRKIQQITRWIFRVVGRLVLQGGNRGGGGSSSDDSSDSGGRKISITLPTYPPASDEDEDDTEAPSTDNSVQESIATTTQGPSDAENQVAESKTSEVKVRKTRQAEDTKASESSSNDNNDLDTNETSNDDADDNEEAANEDDGRNKRFLFNFGGGNGGSGNFLFDIIRRAADRTARAAGQLYRVLAGTDNLDLTSYPSNTGSRPEVPLPTLPPSRSRSLVAGSGTTQEKDEAQNAPVEGAAAPVDHGTPKDDGYNAGVPGPLTRLFVIANRGIANLIQDLILRLAQTSERIVNFKARLITSII